MEPQCPAASHETADNYGRVSGLTQLRLRERDGIYDPLQGPLICTKAGYRKTKRILAAII